MKILILMGVTLALTIGCQRPEPTPVPAPSPGERSEQTHEEGHVEFPPKRQALAQLKVEALTVKPFSEDLQVSGVLSYDENLLTRSTSPLPGRLVELRASLGHRVEAGQVLAIVDAPELLETKMSYHQAQTDLKLARQALERRSKLALYGEEVRRPLEEARNEVNTAQAELKVAQSNEALTRQRLERIGQLLNEGITSRAQWEQARAEETQSAAQVELARQKLRTAQSHLHREQRVASLGLLANKELQEAKADLSRADQRCRDLREGLIALGAQPDQPGSSITVLAAKGGTITERPVTLGESVSAQDHLFTIAASDRLWLWINIVESELGKLKLGQEVEVEVTAYPNKNFLGRTSYLAPELDEKTRTARALVEIDNSGGQLRAAMFAKVRLFANQKSALVLPLQAIQKVEEQDVVYVQETPGEFQRRPLVLGLRNQNQVEILQGLQPGDRVVVENAHLVKAEDLKSELSEGGHSH